MMNRRTYGNQHMAIAVISCIILLCIFVFPVAQGQSSVVVTTTDAVQSVTDTTVFDAADQAGTVVNASRPDDSTQQDRIDYSFTPLDVVLIIEASGSMDRSDGQSWATLLDYAEISANAFANTLFSINPDSRIGIVCRTIRMGSRRKSGTWRPGIR